MKYTIAKMFQILRHNRWVSILMIIEIALGMSVFTWVTLASSLTG